MNRQRIDRYLSQVADEATKVLGRLPEGFGGEVSLFDHSVQLDIQGPRLKKFTLVLGSEAPEIVYDEQFISYAILSEGLEEEVIFMNEVADEIVEFVQSGKDPLEGKSLIRKRKRLRFEMMEGVVRRFKQF